MARGLAVWLLIMAVETVHGVLRGLLLVPRVGGEMAGRIGWPVGMLIVVGITLLTINWIGLARRMDLLKLGVVWMVLTFGFEVAIGYARGLSHEQVLAEINPLAGGLMAYSLIVMLVAPWIAASIRRKTVR